MILIICKLLRTGYSLRIYIQKKYLKNNYKKISKNTKDEKELRQLAKENERIKAQTTGRVATPIEAFHSIQGYKGFIQYKHRQNRECKIVCVNFNKMI